MQIINVSKLNGKLAGFRAIGTNTKTNKFCEKMYNSKGDIICKFCYSHKALEIAYNKNLEPFLIATEAKSSASSKASFIVSFGTVCKQEIFNYFIQTYLSKHHGITF